MSPSIRQHSGSLAANIKMGRGMPPQSAWGKAVEKVLGKQMALNGRTTESRNERLPELAADLVRLHVSVIAAVGGNNSAFAAKAATATIPIVFTSAADPVKVGLVVSINRPGGNVTGVSWFAGELGPKRLGLLHELVPEHHGHRADRKSE
jgi:putative ABC transport system substrate-binding protein